MYKSMLLEAAHYNCPVTGQLDASISNIYFPQDTLDSIQFKPQVHLVNLGSDTLSYVLINFRVDGQSPETYDFIGSLPTEQSANVTLPYYVTNSGPHTAFAWTTNPNHSIDEIPANDTASSSFVVTTLPPCQNTIMIIDQANSSTDQPLVNVQYPCADMMHLQVVNLLGQVIMEGNWSVLNNPSFTIDLSKVSPGIYFIFGKIGNGYVKKKLMIVRK